MMNECELALYGNIIVDHIQEIFEYKIGRHQEGAGLKKRITGIGAVVREMSYLDRNITMKMVSQLGDDDDGKFARYEVNKLKSNLGAHINTKDVMLTSPTPTTTCTTILNGKDFKKFYNWGACRKKYGFKPSKSQWSHICYLDALDYMSSEHLKEMTGRVSADILYENFEGNKAGVVLRLLPYIDYLILSEKSAIALSGKNDVLEAAKTLRRKDGGVVVINHGDGATVFDGEKSTLIAGRYAKVNHSPLFATYFIYSQLSGDKYLDSVRYALNRS